MFSTDSPPISPEKFAAHLLPLLHPAVVASLQAEAQSQGPTGSILDRLRADPAELFTFAGKPPDPWQADLLRGHAQRLLLLCSRQSGKSTTAAALAVKTALLEPGSLTLLLSPTLRQSGELFRAKVLPLWRGLGSPECGRPPTQLALELANGSRIISLPGEGETVRGYSGVTLLAIDEAALVPDELYRAVRPMLAVSRGRLMALSTPNGKRGWFYQEWVGEADWQRVMVTAHQCPRIPADFLEEERRALGQEWFAQEYLCEFSDSGESPLFPTEWLERAAKIAAGLPRERRAKAMGIDPAEGGDRSVWAIIDELGLIYLLSLSTPDTSVITGKTIALMRDYGIPADRVAFDRGGGGKEHADRLRAQGFPVRTVAFGEAVSLDPKRGMTRIEEKMENKEERYVFKNRRAEMYYDLRQLLDPMANQRGFGLPAEYTELRRQLAPMPLKHDGEGRIYMLPKNKKDKDSPERTLTELVGCSPDEADALALACFALLHKATRPRAGVA